MHDQIPQSLLFDLCNLRQHAVGAKIQLLELIAVEQRLRLILMALSSQLQGSVAELLVTFEL
ncbi:hypothetical protein D3C85_1830810 [compost metagenome]